MYNRPVHQHEWHACVNAYESRLFPACEATYIVCALHVSAGGHQRSHNLPGTNRRRSVHRSAACGLQLSTPAQYSVSHSHWQHTGRGARLAVHSW